MRERNLGLAVVGALVISMVSGCKKSESPQSAQGSTNSPPSVPAVITNGALARIHWLGKKQLAADTNSVELMRLWAEPESAELEGQTVDKLSSAPWRLWAANSTASATDSLASAQFPQAFLLKPLIYDLVQQEFYLELGESTNKTPELALAIKLDDEQDARWRTNLQLVHASLATAKDETNTLANLQFARVQGWTVVGSAGPENRFFSALTSKMEKEHSLAPGETNWLVADLDLGRFSRAFATGWHLPEDSPGLSVRLNGDGANVRTRGTLTFSHPLNNRLERWHIPTNLITAPLNSFTAVRGIAPMLRLLKPFSDLPGDIPDQILVWGRPGPPDIFFSLPCTNASVLFERFGSQLTELVTPFLGRDYGSVNRETNSAELHWDGLPHANPFLKAITNGQNQYVFGGFVPFLSALANPMPPELVNRLLGDTNLVCLDWEVTGDSVVHWRYLDDVYRIIFDRHGPRLTDTASLRWFDNNLTNLSVAITEARLSSPTQLTFARKSTVGFTGLELDLLANWLELPQFPAGLGTLLATNAAPLPKTKLRSTKADGSAVTPTDPHAAETNTAGSGK
ncbi:MAG TPA: hypothetical protein VLT36_02835 [Candidatus Dormibacteraeota bacterium]|nr:hypothetical protein [Candidatus Dormibacteraeota bacterium]